MGSRRSTANKLSVAFWGFPWLPLLVGLAVAALLTFPYLLMARLQASPPGTSGRPVSTFSLFGITGDVDQSFYAARVREAGDAWFPYSPYIEGNRTQRLLLTGGAGFFLMGRLQSLTGDVDWTWMLARAILVFGWTMILFSLMNGATGSRLPALVCAAVLVLFGDIAWVPVQWRMIRMQGFWPALLEAVYSGTASSRPLGPVRLLSPCLTVFMLLSAGWFAVRSMDSRSGRFRGVPAGLAAGLLAYFHTDVWVVGMIGLAGLAAWAWVKRRRDAGVLLEAVILGIVVSLPWSLVVLGLDMDFLVRNKAGWSHAMEPGSWFFFAAGIGAIALSAKVRVSARPLFVWTGAALFGAALGMNIQVLTGISVQPFHWALVGMFLVGLLAASCVCLLFRGGRRWVWGAAAVIVALLASFRGTSYARTNFGSHRLWSQTREALDWLKANAPPGSVVAALSPEANLLLPIHAGVRTLAACNTPVASDLTTFENAERLVYGAGLLGVGEREFLSRALAEPPKLFDDTPYAAGEEYRITLGAEKVLFPYVFFNEYPRDKLAALFRGVFHAFPRHGFRADYVWIGPFERELLGGKVPARWKQPLFKNAWVAIYEAPEADGTDRRGRRDGAMRGR